MQLKIIKKPVNKSFLLDIAKNQFVDLVKAVIDVEQELVAVGGELHADEEALLLEKGSKQQNLWGINLYPDKKGDEFIEFDSVINIRPSQENRTRGVEQESIRIKIKEIINKLFK